MATNPQHANSTIDAPILALASAVTVGISAVWNSEPVDLAGFTHFCLLYSVVGASTHAREVNFSNDGVTWHDMQVGGEVASSAINASGQASGNRAFMAATNGCRYLRLQITGNATNTLALTASVSLVRRA